MRHLTIFKVVHQSRSKPNVMGYIKDLRRLKGLTALKSLCNVTLWNLLTSFFNKHEIDNIIASTTRSFINILDINLKLQAIQSISFKEDWINLGRNVILQLEVQNKCESNGGRYVLKRFAN